MDPYILQQGHRIQGLTTNSGHQILGNNFSAGGNNVFNINNGLSTEEVERKNCLRALFVSNPVDDRAKYISFKGEVIKSTFTWIVEHDVYQSWVNQATGSDLLWLSGGPGMGKTMLSIFLTQELEKLKSERAIVLYYFCEGRDSRRSSAVNILRGLIFSLVQQRPALIKHLLPDFEVQQEVLFGPEGVEPLWRILLKMVHDPETGPVYCIIDGLDECAQTSLAQLQHVVLKVQNFYQHALERHSQSGSLQSQMGSLAISPRQSQFDPSGINTAILKLALVSREAPVFLKEALSSFNRLRLENPVIQKPDQQPQLQTGYNTHHTPEASIYVPEQMPTGIDGTFVQPAQQPFPDTQGLTSAEPLQLYIKARIDDLAIHKGYDDRFRTELQQSLHSRGDGSYLWVDSALEQLSKANAQSAEQVVADLPNGIEGIWCQSLLQVPLEHVPLISTVLKWVTVAFRPLTVVELKTILIACNVLVEDTDTDADTLSVALKSCSTLLDVSKDDEVKLCHQSIKDFLTRENSPLLQGHFLQEYHVDMKSMHGEAAQTLIKYVQESCFKDGWYDLVSAGVDPWTHDEIKPYEETTKYWPLIIYASLNWPEHMNQGRRRAIDLTSTFFQPENKVRDNWFTSVWGARKRRDGRMAPSRTTILHVAAFFDLIELMEHLATEPDFATRVQKKDGEGRTPLYVAAIAGSLNVMACILDSGYRAEDMCELFSVIDLLLERFGVDLSHLQIATLSGHYEVVKFLLQKGADPLWKTCAGWTNLHFAAWSGDSSMFELVLEYGGTLHALTGDRWTCLHVAARRGKISAGEYLLGRGFQIDARADRSYTPLHFAASYGHRDMVRLLLEQGANHALVTDKGMTPLHLAAKKGHDAAVKVLLEFGANRHAVNNSGETALKIAKGGRHSTIADLLNAPEPVSFTQPVVSASTISASSAVQGAYAPPYQQNQSSYAHNNQFQEQLYSNSPGPYAASQVPPQFNASTYPTQTLPSPPPLPPRPQHTGPLSQSFQGYEAQYTASHPGSLPDLHHSNSYPSQPQVQPNPAQYHPYSESQSNQPQYQHANSYPNHLQIQPQSNYRPSSPQPPPNSQYYTPQPSQQTQQPYWAPPPAPAYSPPPNKDIQSNSNQKWNASLGSLMDRFR